MSDIRIVKSIRKSVPTVEGAGVHLKRVFGNDLMYELDPFLLLDDFQSNDKSKYIKGFPWHPHRGIETITYMLHGRIEHRDSLGNEGVINPGDVQWMTAGSGIIHEEMPGAGSDGRMWGLQLWANLPASHKMMQPRYRGIQADTIPVMKTEKGIEVRVICGRFGNIAGPVTDVIIDPQYLDVSMPVGKKFIHPLPDQYTAFAYVLEGSARFDEEPDRFVDAENLIVYEKSGEIHITTAQESVRFLLIAGRPIREPISWYGPIVMNTQDEIKKAVEEYQEGEFLKFGSEKL